MRKSTSKRRWIARAKLGRLIPALVIVQRKLRGPWHPHRNINVDAAYMTEYNITRFLHMWRERTLENDVTWRGYHIPAFAMAEAKTYAPRALKAIGLGYAGEHGPSTFARLYDVPEYFADKILAAWWVWARLADGRRVRGVPKRSQTGEGGFGYHPTENSPDAAQPPSKPADDPFQQGG